MQGSQRAVPGAAHLRRNRDAVRRQRTHTLPVTPVYAGNKAQRVAVILPPAGTRGSHHQQRPPVPGQPGRHQCSAQRYLLRDPDGGGIRHIQKQYHGLVIPAVAQERHGSAVGRQVHLVRVDSDLCQVKAAKQGRILPHDRIYAQHRAVFIRVVYPGIGPLEQVTLNNARHLIVGRLPVGTGFRTRPSVVCGARPTSCEVHITIRLG